MQNPAPSEEHFGQLPEIMMNAYFPQKRLFRGRREWSMRNGRYEIQVRANATIPSCDKREIDNKPEVEVPYGFAARVILPYLFGRALRGEPVVKIGPNLNQIFLARINHQFENWAPYCLEISLQYCLWPVQSMIRHFSAQLKHKVSNLVVIEQLLALVRHYRADCDALATPGASTKTGHWMC